MQKPLLISATVLGLIAGAISVIRTKPMFQAELDTLSAQDRSLAEAKNALKEEGEKADAAENGRKAAETEKTTTENSIQGLNSAIAALGREKTSLDSRLSDLQEDKTKLDATLDELRVALQNALGTTITEINPEDISGRVAQMNDETKKRQAEIDETQKQVDALQEQIAARTERVNALEQQQARQRQIYEVNSWSGQVTGVDSEWGFVVFSGGTGRGLPPTAKYIVVRGTQPIANLEVVNMEQGRTIANISEESLRRGAQVVPGDRVILAEPISGR